MHVAVSLQEGVWYSRSRVGRKISLRYRWAFSGQVRKVTPSLFALKDLLPGMLLRQWEFQKKRFFAMCSRRWRVTASSSAPHRTVGVRRFIRCQRWHRWCCVVLRRAFNMCCVENHASTSPVNAGAQVMPRCGATSCVSRHNNVMMRITRTIESHEPVHNDSASFDTPRQLTRLS